MYDERGMPIKGRSTHEPPAYAANASVPSSSTNHLRDGEIVPRTAPTYAAHEISARQEWGIGMCESCCNRCHLVWMFSHVCLFPCQAGRIYNAACNDIDDSANMGVSCAICLLSPLCITSPLAAACLRRHVTGKYNIDNESAVETFCRGCICPLCSQCQVQRQLEMNGRHPGIICCGESHSEARARAPPQTAPMSPNQSVHSPFDPSTVRGQRRESTSDQPGSSAQSDRTFHTVSSRVQVERS